MSKSKRKITKSILDHPVKVEMGIVKHTSSHALTTEELAIQIEEARKGTARVDSKYVGLGDGLEHLFEYKYDWVQFLESILHIITEGKKVNSAENDSHFHSTHHGTDNRMYSSGKDNKPMGPKSYGPDVKYGKCN
jgi:hypothetical protein